ncbi:tetratricopeptide repeat protein [Reichenbachiella versicolor]|uniref:tetratricopeptide repeat protein n=1 Tax=Reichenbachiella versicolor TaxID=1821036 RepID=UPI000D6E97B6|nr:tetratricopeptide repeat protein [Reichenbachiella versicolor]
MSTIYEQFKALSTAELKSIVRDEKGFSIPVRRTAYYIVLHRGEEIAKPSFEKVLNEDEESRFDKKGFYSTYDFSPYWILAFLILSTWFLVLANTSLPNSEIYQNISLFTQGLLSAGSISIIVNLVAFFLFFLTTKNRIKRFIKDDNTQFQYAIIIVGLGVIILLMFETLFDDEYTFSAIVRYNSFRSFLGNLIYLILIGIVEEVIHKWLLLNQLTRLFQKSSYSKYLIVFVVSILFALWHIPRDNVFFGGIDFGHLIFTFFYSFFTSIIYLRDRNLFLLIAIHICADISYIMVPADLNIGSSAMTANFIILMLLIKPIYRRFYFKSIKLRLKLCIQLFGSIFLLLIVSSLFTNLGPFDHLKFAKFHFRLGNFEVANEHILDAKTSNPTHEYYSLKGRISYGLDDYYDSYDALSKAIKLKPDGINEREVRGWLNYDLDNYEQAIDDLTFVIKNGRNSIRNFSDRAYCFLALNSFEEAMSDYHSILSINPNNDDALLGLARVNEKLDNQKEAEFYLRQCINLNPNNFQACQKISLVLVQREELDSALYYANRSIQLGSTSKVRFYIRGVIYYNQGKYRQAIDDFVKSLELNPENGDMHYYLAESYAALNDMKSACINMRRSSALGNIAAKEKTAVFCN